MLGREVGPISLGHTVLYSIMVVSNQESYAQGSPLRFTTLHEQMALRAYCPIIYTVHTLLSLPLARGAHR